MGGVASYGIRKEHKEELSRHKGPLFTQLCTTNNSGIRRHTYAAIMPRNRRDWSTTQSSYCVLIQLPPWNDS